MPRTSLHALYVSQLRDLYSTERQVLHALPLMAARAWDPALRETFSQHEAQTRRHAERLLTIFARLGEVASVEPNLTLDAILRAGTEARRRWFDSDVLDAALIAAAQHVSHYEMAGYDCARTYAATLGYDEPLRMLQDTLAEERTANQTLAALGMAVVRFDVTATSHA